MSINTMSVEEIIERVTSIDIIAFEEEIKLSVYYKWLFSTF